ncbi:MAG TPA: efflux RND transporter periplasmic adaptor subunit [Chryseosolibacter sp.]
MRLILQPIFFGALVFSLILGACKKEENPAAAAGGRGRQQGPVPVDAFVVKPSSISEEVEVPGSLLPFEETAIAAEVGGRIVQMNINEGTTVEKGTLLVKLFDQDLQAQLKKLQVQLKINEKTEERNRELLKINAISQQDYDLSNLNVENLRADIESTRIAISKTEIRAPYRGTVGLRNVSLGSFIAPGAIITTVRQVERLKLDFAVPEKYAQQIEKNYKVKFRVDGGTKDHFASVIATENSVDQNTRTLRVKAVVNERHPELVPGIFARINLQLGQDDKALLVPTQAVIPSIRNKQVIVFRKDSALFTVVQTGIRDSSYVQILEGLKAGDTVVTTGLMAIRPNSKLKITKVKTL